MTLDRLKYDFRRFRQRDEWATTCIVAINVLVFLLVMVCGPNCLPWVGVSGSAAEWLRRPWTLFTYMFVQVDGWNLMCNMLLLWCFAQVLMISVRRSYVWWLYVAGGLCGGILYLIADVVGVPESGLVGSSASMLAVVTAATMRSPYYQLRLLLVGNIRLRWIALVVILVSMLVVIGGNFGSAIAHLGGVLAGFVWGWCLRYRGRDLLAPFTRPRYHRTEYSPAADKFKRNLRQVREDNTDLDLLLDKVRVSGYGSLTRQEREKLRTLSEKV